MTGETRPEPRQGHALMLGLGRPGQVDWLTALLFVLSFLLVLGQAVVSPAGRFALIVLGGLCVLLATAGFARIERSSHVGVVLTYMAAQFGIAAGLVQVSGRVDTGIVLLLLLTLSQGTRRLPLGWVLLFCGLLPFLNAWAAPGDVVRVGIGHFLAGVFVVLTTRVALNERLLRAEKEALAEQLGQANAQLKAYALQADELSTARERSRIAREIHDGLGHHLTAVHVQIQAAHAVLRHDPDRAEQALKHGQAMTQAALDDVRRSVSALRVTHRALGEELAILARDMTTAGTPTRFTAVGMPRHLKAQAEQDLFRAAQEGLTNVRKHARASQAWVTLTYCPAEVQLTIRDDGLGTNAGRVGLLGLRERVAALGGRVDLETASGQGLALIITVPA